MADFTAPRIRGMLRFMTQAVELKHPQKDGAYSPDPLCLAQLNRPKGYNLSYTDNLICVIRSFTVTNEGSG